MDYKEAQKLGYRVGKPVNPSRKLKDLCSSLGPEYHIALIDGGNVIHRIIGDGLDFEIFPESRRYKEYRIVLWEDNFHITAQENNASPENIHEVCEQMIKEYYKAEND